MPFSRRDFLRCAAGWGGVLLLGGLPRPAQRHAASLRAAVDWLVSQQSRDGAWRSRTYAAFRGGDALTPLVLWALQSVPSPLQPHTALDRARAWVAQLGDAPLVYPLFTASYAAQVFAQAGDAARAATWADRVERLRISPALGWPAESPAGGAWSDSAEPPRYVQPLPDMIAPNLSATLLAQQALAAVGRDPRSALRFIERCQNFAASDPGPFDDGGFFFTEADPIRNKAGAAGRDPNGVTRFRSYGAATCDGVLALRACGLDDDHLRIRAALAWLERHAHGAAHNGHWPADRQTAQQSLVFYQAQAFAGILARGSQPALYRAFIADLSDWQSPEGSWTGAAPDSCEDDPLVATAFATRALAELQPTPV